MQTFYNNLIRETQNWEDFVLEGGGARGCCNVDPDGFDSVAKCTAECKNCGSVQIKPAAPPYGTGCTTSVPYGKIN